MRELGRAAANSSERAEAAARLERSTNEWTLSQSAADLPDVRTMTFLPEKIFHTDKKDLPTEKEKVYPLPKSTKETHELTRSVVADSKLLGPSEAKAGKPSASALISKVLENPRRTRDELLDCLALVPDLHVEAAAREVEVLDAARDARLSWQEIAEAQHLASRQVALKRYKSLKEGISSLLDDKAGDSGKSPS